MSSTRFIQCRCVSVGRIYVQEGALVSYGRRRLVYPRSKPIDGPQGEILLERFWNQENLLYLTPEARVGADATCQMLLHKLRHYRVRAPWTLSMPTEPRSSLHKHVQWPGLARLHTSVCFCSVSSAGHRDNILVMHRPTPSCLRCRTKEALTPAPRGRRYLRRIHAIEISNPRIPGMIMTSM